MGNLEKKWRNLLIIIFALIVIAVALLFLRGREQDFVEGIEEINSYWLAKDVNVARLNEADLNRILGLEQNDIEIIKERTAIFQQKTNNPALKRAAAVYVALADFITKTNRLSETEEQVAEFGFGDTCGPLTLLKEKNSREEEWIESITKLTSAADELNKNHPKESEMLGIQNLGVSSEGLYMELEKSREYVAELEEFCRK